MCICIIFYLQFCTKYLFYESEIDNELQYFEKILQKLQSAKFYFFFLLFKIYRKICIRIHVPSEWHKKGRDNVVTIFLFPFFDIRETNAGTPQFDATAKSEGKTGKAL